MNLYAALAIVLGFLARVQAHGIPALWLAAFTVAALSAGVLLLAAGQLVRDARRTVPA